MMIKHKLYLLFLLIALFAISSSEANLLKDALEYINPLAFTRVTPDFNFNPREIQQKLKREITRPMDINDPSDVSDFFDSFFTENSQSLAGATVALVSNGQITFSKGYGIATNTEKANEKSVFCAASVSKSFTATAILQLVDQGKLDINESIDKYLPAGIVIPNPFGDKVTVGDLLTHTAGFEERQPWTIVHELNELDTIENFVKNRMPPRRWPVKTLASYSNHAYTLAGFLVQTVSGMPFDEYMQKNIFVPLGMNQSTFNYEKVDQKNLAMEYLWNGIQNAEFPLKYFVNIIPAGGLYTTANDLAQFMIAQLNGGKHGNTSILSKALIDLQHSNAYVNGKAMTGIGYGFYFYEVNGKKIINHDGDMLGYTASFWMVPSENTGVVLLQNNKASFRQELMVKFMDTFYPGTNPVLKPGTSTNLEKLTGPYMDTRTDRNSYMGFMNTFGLAYDVSLEGSYLTFATLYTLNDKGNDTFTIPDLNTLVDTLSFKGDNFQYISAFSPISTFERTSLLNTPVIMSIVVFGTTLLMLILCCVHSCFLCCGTSQTIKGYQQYGQPEENSTRSSLRNQAFGAVLATFFLQLISVFGIMIAVTSNGPLFNPGFGVTIMLIFPYLLVVSGLGLLITAARAFTTSGSLEPKDTAVVTIMLILTILMVTIFAIKGLYFAL